MTENEAKTQTKLFSLIWVLIALFASVTFLTISIVYFSPENRSVETITQTRTNIAYDKFLTGIEVNDILSENRELYFNAVGFYTNITRSNEIAKTILDAALTRGVPVNLAFAIAWQESRFNPNAVNENGNDTTDHGLYQINSYYHPNVDAYNIQEASMYAMDYLLDQYERFYDWEIAGMLYNAGNVENISDHSLRYMAGFTEKEREFDEQFNSFRRNLNISSL